MEFRRTRRFTKALKVYRKYRSLPDDIRKLEVVLSAIPEGNGSKHWNCLHPSEDGNVRVFKVRLSCASMKGESRFRVIYAHVSGSGTVDLIDFIEIYSKGDKANEDKGLIGEYIDDPESLF
jgi:hypothetical protein